MERGKLIVFEGVGGSGKGTQINLLRDYLLINNKTVLVTNEHTRDTGVGNLIENTIKKRSEEMDPTALQVLFVADRINHSQRVILPALSEYDFVLEDRYEGSTISYAPQEQRDYFLNLHKTDKILTPDLVFILNTDLAEAARRIGKRGDADIFDTTEKMRVCLEGYKWYEKHSGHDCVWIDGNGNKEEVSERIIEEIKIRKII
mgnify:CR=1 FL=1